MLDNPQETFNRGSSETTCETFSNLLKFDLDFKYWFIGFTEGDGSFIINTTGYLEFKVTQSSKDSQILFYIKKNWVLVLFQFKIKFLKRIIIVYVIEMVCLN